MSSGYTFGGKPGESSTFGQAQQQQVAGFTFGTPQTSAPALPQIGAGTTNFQFTTLQTSTAASTLGGNLPLGVQNPQTGLTFGTSTAPPTLGQSFLGLQTTAAPTLGTSLGGGGGLMFNAPASTMAAPLPSFGPIPPASSSGMTFNTSAAVSSSGFTVPSTLPKLALSFGTTPSTGFSLGTSTITTQPTASTIPTTQATANIIPTTTVTLGPTVNFSSIATPSTVSLPSFNLPKSTALAFPAPATASATPGFNLGSSLTTTSNVTSLNFGLTTMTVASTAMAPPISTTTSSASVGLGGISTAPMKQPTSAATLAEVAPKDQPLPNELMQSVENFKKYVQEQKTFSSEISWFSMKELKKVEIDIDLVNNGIAEMESELQKNRAVAEKLKNDTAKTLQHVEMAQRTFEVPAGLQYDNSTPLNYFIELCDGFERDMYNLKVNIENIDNHVRNSEPLPALTSQDLAVGMRRLHETFVALAGRLQAVHNQVELQKDQYLNLRKTLLNDYTNVFENRSKELDALESALDSVPYQPPTIYTGPTPFNSMGSSQAQALGQNPPPAYSGTTTVLGSSSTPNFGLQSASTTSLFKPVTTQTSFFGTTSGGFQLQKPPVGNKRGKP